MQKIFFFTALILSCALLYSPSSSMAGEGGLYPAAPPAGSAFVRFLNGSNPLSLAVNIRGKSYGAAALGNITAYAPVPQGDANLTFGAKSVTAHLKEGAYYTVLLAKEVVSVLQEPSGDDKLKAQIIVINASSTPGITLKTADGSTTIVSAVDPEKLDGRAVNAVKIPLSVYAAKNKVGDIDAQLLERGSRYAVVVYDGSNGKPTVSFN
jgi:alginate O-acetyltransferase complex protein AlgF